MNNYFCSLVTKSHISHIISTFYSIYRFNNNYVLFLVIIDDHDDDINKISNNFKTKLFNKNSIKIVKLSDIINSDNSYLKIYNKYVNYTSSGKDMMRNNNKVDILRYSIKVCLISYLLKYTNIDSVIWIDCDLYFISDINDIFDILKTKEVVLTPHFRNTKNEMNRHLIFRDGFFNVGFIGFNKTSICLDWYIQQIYFTCDLIDGYYYYEQKYLDYFPVLTDNIEILRCGNYNISEWNIDTCIREIKENNNLYIIKDNNISKPIFFHFTKYYIDMINNNLETDIIKNYLDEYVMLQKLFS